MKMNLKVFPLTAVVVLFALSVTGYGHGKHDESATIKANIPLNYPLFVLAEDSQPDRDNHAGMAIESRHHFLVATAKARVAKSTMAQDEGELVVLCWLCNCFIVPPLEPFAGHLIVCNLTDCSLHPGKWCGGVV
jgi:hypothetical protein